MVEIFKRWLISIVSVQLTYDGAWMPDSCSHENARILIRNKHNMILFIACLKN